MNIEFPSSTWKDYELVDSGDFEKLERFGTYYLRRPEPKALWHKSMSEEQWKRFYMGDDGKYTFYCDAVEKKFAKSSTSSKRYDLMDDVVDMFNIIREESQSDV